MTRGSVSKPIGESRTTAGSSLIVARKTSAAPASTPLRASGIVTDQATASGERPETRAASSSRGGTCSSAARADPTASGRKRTTIAITSIASDW